jgi:hypothetical protein
MKWVSQFARFWYDFVVGDDWTIAAAVVVVLVAADLLAHSGRVAWPIVPIGVALVLSVSVWRVLRVHQRDARRLREGGSR